MKKILNKLPDKIFRYITEQLYDGVYFVNTDRKILFWNKQAVKISGFSAKEVLNSYCYDNILQHIDSKGKSLCNNMCPLTASIKNNKPYAKRVYLRRKDGVRIPVDVHTAPVAYSGEILGAIEVFRDASIYERMERQRDKAKNIAMVDVLTSLPNRRFILQKFKSEIKKFMKFGDDLHVAIIDVDYFKDINDTYGHDKGDLILRKLADLLDHSLRPTDYIGRYGGEEFIVLLSNTPKSNAKIALERVRDKVEKAKLFGKTRKITISIGLTQFKNNDSTATAFKRVDKALYAAKLSGRNKIKYVN